MSIRDYFGPLPAWAAERIEAIAAETPIERFGGDIIGWLLDAFQHNKLTVNEMLGFRKLLLAR